MREPRIDVIQHHPCDYSDVCDQTVARIYRVSGCVAEHSANFVEMLIVMCQQLVSTSGTGKYSRHARIATGKAQWPGTTWEELIRDLCLEHATRVNLQTMRTVHRSPAMGRSTYFKEQTLFSVVLMQIHRFSSLSAICSLFRLRRIGFWPWVTENLDKLQASTY
jgi:hypothetical protein